MTKSLLWGQNDAEPAQHAARRGEAAFLGGGSAKVKRADGPHAERCALP
jgi:hypothetical protein